MIGVPLLLFFIVKSVLGAPEESWGTWNPAPAPEYTNAYPAAPAAPYGAVEPIAANSPRLFLGEIEAPVAIAEPAQNYAPIYPAQPAPAWGAEAPAAPAARLYIAPREETLISAPIEGPVNAPLYGGTYGSSHEYPIEQGNIRITPNQGYSTAEYPAENVRLSPNQGYSTGPYPAETEARLYPNQGVYPPESGARLYPNTEISTKEARLYVGPTEKYPTPPSKEGPARLYVGPKDYKYPTPSKETPRLSLEPYTPPSKGTPRLEVSGGKYPARLQVGKTERVYVAPTKKVYYPTPTYSYPGRVYSSKKHHSHHNRYGTYY